MDWISNISDQMKALLDSIHNPIIAIDAAGAVIVCNLAAERLTGLSAAELLGRPLTSVITTSKLHRIVRTGVGELVQKIEIGGKIYLSNRTAIVVDGRVAGAVAVLQDISELEAISNELENTKLISEELNAIIESSFDGIYVTDGQAKTLRVNQAYERITGIKREEVLGRTMSDLVLDGFFNESVTLRVLESKRPTSLIQRIKTGKTVMVTGNPIFDRDGRMRLVVTNVRDVTELNRLQQKLAKMDKLQTEAEIELQRLRETMRGRGEIVLRSKKMQELRQLALRLAQVESTVLIQGESGVGKEIFAEMIHGAGPRRHGPFIKISCAAIPDQLLESELFGYAAGAFTGAKKEGKVGIFEAANTGSIFLDEIGEMPLNLQAKLLRALQVKEIQRIGDPTPIKVDVRIMAATNRNLEDMIAMNLFRQDLFFRLNVVNVVIPPLRERTESILPFIYHFLDKYNRIYGLSRQLDREVPAILLDYDWPGNVRELENLVERLVVVSPGDIITRESLPEKFKSRTGVAPEDQAGDERSLPELVAEVERRALEQARRRHKTTRGMARALGVDQSTVVRKLKKHGLA
ncbi:MAG: sigma 54-interacting transcriptional regulator [Pseudomonadota bacterium]